MKNPIVVGVNDSGSSEAALAWAMHRAAALKMPVLLVHAVDDRWTYDTPGYYEMLRKAGAELVATAKARALAEAPSVDVRTMLGSGSPGYALRKRSKDAAMMVIGSGHAWPGGTLTDRALQIAAVATCPVAVIGEHDPAARHGILVGVDGSEESTQAVAFAAAEADRDGQGLTVLHAFRGPNRWVQKGMPESNFAELIVEEERIVLAETIAGLADIYPDLVVHQVLETDKEPADALVASAQDARLLVLGSRGRGSFKRLMLGSTAHTVLTHLPCPTIITRVRTVKHAR
ncbi:universal stress protein [Arthrobacter sp. Soil762]|uniref:universal stress protein n=1 Tax=Arthrobacter sp. Soil762 TaxID=1736401 RepID=UPI0006F8EB79|nr:universal stress protein [Arthrobacter sp. Soil762]KRE80425.1 universal stress protein UspA [Arthrobacter sp. Soil762]